MISLKAALRLLIGLGASYASLASPASAALKAGAAAPAFDTPASLGGKVFDFDISRALEKGPVVLYFYPAAFTTACTLEAHDFASHIDDYKKLGATVIGVSGDDIEKLNKFSVSECRSKFAVASDADHKISREYDAVIGFGPVTYSDRTSYVIARDGKIAYAYRSADPAKHVANTLDALKALAK
ncbi:MAG: peroxiredoxin [Candidatus Eremiobacteraeota bacterium]|nr:peroxiredoxin [Candidatus Eremiobacteraeota bacterium]